MEPTLTTGWVFRFVDGLEAYLNELEVIPNGEATPLTAVLMLLSKALTVARATCVLVDAGFPAEALGLSRTLVDLYFNVKYICNRDGQARAEQFVNYWAKIYEELGKIRARFYPDDEPIPPDFHDRAMQMAAEFRSKHAWTGLGGQAAFIARENSNTRRASTDEKSNETDFDYVLTYFITGQFVHATILSLASHTIEPGKVFRAHGKKEEDGKFGTITLHNIVEYLSKTFSLASEGLGIKDPEIKRRCTTL
jgi:hypothetical protein